METLDKIKKVISDDVALAKERMESGAKSWWQLNRRLVIFCLAGAIVGAVVALVLFG